MMRLKELLQAFVQRRHFLSSVQRMVRGADFPDDRGAHDLIDRVAHASVLPAVIILVRIRKDLVPCILDCRISFYIGIDNPYHF